MSSWVNFKILRSKLDFRKVLDHYGVKDDAKNGQVMTFCPMPNHGGKRNSPSFSANLNKGIFQCFGCGAKGNVLDFAVLMEKQDPANGADVRKVALELQRRFGIATRVVDDSPRPPQPLSRRRSGTLPSQEECEVIINAPLPFALTGLDPDHPYLANRGFTPETIDHFDLGFCPRGHFQGRIVIPLRNQEGDLIGYAGRIVDDAKVSKDTPKYLFPGKRTIEGKLHEFRKSLFLYNGHRFDEPVQKLIIVEGFASVWWLTQNGYPNVVALMGSTLCDEQEALILSLIHPEGKAYILTDGDFAGKRCGGLLHSHIGSKRFTLFIQLRDKVQPTSLSKEELDDILDLD